MTALLLGWVGTVLILSFNVPQVWRTCVDGRTDGVPPMRAWVAIAVAVVWLGYGLAGGGLVQVVLNGATILLNLLLVVGLRGREAGRGTLLVAAAAVTTLALGAMGGRHAIGAVGAAVGSGVYLPQLLALRRTGSADGVSAVALALQVSGALCWLGYGLLRNEPEVWVPNAFVLLTVVWTQALLRTALVGARA